MSGRKNADSFPLKSLHDFLSELDNEWDRFRTASLIGIITSSVLLIFLILRVLAFLALIRRPGAGAGLLTVLYDLLFLILIVAFVVYEISLLIRQYRFFKKWERRVGLLLHIEERLMGNVERKEEDHNEDSEQ